MSSKSYTDPGTLRELHHKQRLTPPQIADELGVCRATIYDYLNRHGIEKLHLCGECGREFDNPQSLRSHKRTHKGEKEPYKDADRIRELYYGEKMTQKEVAEEFGCHLATVKRWMNRHGIETRSHMEAVKNRWRLEPAEFVTGKDGYEFHRTNYEGERLQFRHHRLLAVALYGFDSVKDKHVHHKSGVEWDNRHSNLELLTPSEHSNRHASDRVEAQEINISKRLCETFREEYPEGTYKELGEKYGVSQGTVNYHVLGKCQH